MISANLNYFGLARSSLTSTTLLKRNDFTWTYVVECPFDKLKQAMCTIPVLAMPDFPNPFTIESDACDNGLGVVLLQDEHPIVFTRKFLSGKNLVTSTYEKEIIVIFHAVQNWQ